MLKSNVTWDWNEEVDQEFRNAKSRLSKGQEIHPFDVNLPTMLLTDASRLNGLGFALMQKILPEKKANTPENTTNEDIKERWHMIKCGSVSLTDCQRRYATCELEALAIVWACKTVSYTHLTLPTKRIV